MKEIYPILYKRTEQNNDKMILFHGMIKTYMIKTDKINIFRSNSRGTMLINNKLNNVIHVLRQS
jgi:hypothetical protein